jgi:hypothetical protein
MQPINLVSSVQWKEEAKQQLLTLRTHNGGTFRRGEPDISRMLSSSEDWSVDELLSRKHCNGLSLSSKPACLSCFRRLQYLVREPLQFRGPHL